MKTIVRMKGFRTIKSEGKIRVIKLSSLSRRRSTYQSLCPNPKTWLGAFFDCMASQRLQIQQLRSRQNHEEFSSLLVGVLRWGKCGYNKDRLRSCKKLPVTLIIPSGLNLSNCTSQARRNLIETIVMFLIYSTHSCIKAHMEITSVWCLKYLESICLKFLRGMIIRVCLWI